MIISLKAEFKGRPKVFEVGITGILEQSGLGTDTSSISLPLEENRLLRSLFWNNAKEVYQEIIKVSYDIPKKES